MEKAKAQEIINKAAAENKKLADLWDFINEDGDGYYPDPNMTPYQLVMDAGYAVVNNRVYDRADFEAMKTAWNNACIALKGQKVNIGIIVKKSGVEAGTLSSLKYFFNREKND